MIVKRLNGQTYDLDSAEIRTLKFLAHSPTPINNFSRVDGHNGVIDNGTTFDARDIDVTLLANANDRATFSLLRDEIFDILSSGEAFYIIHRMQKGKQWLVKVKTPYNIPQKHYYGEFDVTFTAIQGFAESVVTTQYIQQKGLLNADNISFGMGLETVDDSELAYNHTGSSFKVFNAGNVDIHPFESYLKIEIKNVTGSSSNFSLINRTNNSRFTVSKAVASSEVWLIDGPVIKRNSLMAASDTTKEFICLSPGWNTFNVSGASSANVSFDFNFLYR